MRLFIVAALLAQATFSSRTEIVPIPVTVTDSMGRHVAGLTQEQFEVYEGRRRQPIVAFLAGEAPITLGLVIDYSLSMRPRMSAIVGALESFGRAVRPDDELFLVQFNDDIAVAQPGPSIFANDIRQLMAPLSASRPVGATALYDGVVEGLDRLRTGHGDRKALIVISDGVDNASHRTAAQMIEAARQSGAVTYAISLLEPDDDPRDARVLERLSRSSGGTFQALRSADEAAAALTHIAEDLRQQYTIGIAPSEGRPGTRTIEVRVRTRGRDSLRVRARSTYVAPAP